MKIKAIQALADNYIWVIEERGKALLVDPGQARLVQSFLAQEEVEVEGILLTHNHDDHIGGVLELKNMIDEIAVYGPIETEDLNTVSLQEGDTFDWLGHSFEILKTSGHTQEHISYLLDDHLFCGDALFSAGCGRVFTGDYQAQYETMKKFKSLDDQVKVYAGHEYTLTNLEFAYSQEPNNVLIEKELNQVRRTRKNGEMTLPSTIEREKEINLFMQADNLEEFIRLREARDNF